MNRNLLLILPFLLIDCLIAIYKLDYNYLNFRSQFWIFHLINCFVFYRVNEKKLKIKLEFYDLFIIFFPVLGFTLLILKNTLPLKGKFVLESEDISTLSRTAQEKMELEYMALNSELNTLSIYEILNTKDPKEKKNFIMKFDFPNEKYKVDFYKAALGDDDIDVKHFAAVELNRLDERFQNNLRKIKKRNDPDQLADALIAYCDSGLLNGIPLKDYQKRAVELLKNSEELNNHRLLKLLKLYNDMNEKNRCQEILNVKIFLKNCSKDILKFAANFYYNENDFNMVKIIEKKLNEEG